MPTWCATRAAMALPEEGPSNDKTAVVTGGARGIGRACVQVFKQPGSFYSQLIAGSRFVMRSVGSHIDFAWFIQCINRVRNGGAWICESVDRWTVPNGASRGVQTSRVHRDLPG